MIIPEEGQLLLVDKPLEWTSFDVVKKLKYALRPRKIGHAGTLDPLATGLLLIGVNKFTKKLTELQGLDKTYSGTFEIGKTTSSYDLETEFDSEVSWEHITATDIESVQQKLTGEIEQFPPAHSAVKIQGQRAYKLARKNEEVQLKSRNVNIYRFELTLELPDVHFVVHVSKGTYIRSLAHDFGQLLGVGAYLKSLRRIAVGEYQVNDAYQLNELLEKIQSEKSKKHESN